MVMVDTCQANTMYQDIYSPNVIATGSSQLGENSYSHHNDMDIGVAVIDSFTHYVLQYLEGIDKGSKATMQDFVRLRGSDQPTVKKFLIFLPVFFQTQFNIYDPEKIKSHPGIRKDLFPFDLQQTLVTDFFGGVSHVQIPLSHGNASLRGGVTNGTDIWHDLVEGEGIRTGLPAAATNRGERSLSSPVSDNSSFNGSSASKAHDLSSSLTGSQDWLVMFALGLLFFTLSWTTSRPGRLSRKVKNE